MTTVEDLLRQLGPRVLGVLVRRGADFASAEDAVQEALIEAVTRWPEGMPSDPQAWLVTVAWRRWLDHVRSESARHRRERADLEEPPPGPTEQADDTLHLLFLCCHPALSPSSAVALTLRAVGGLTTRQVAEAYLVPESTMAQRISRAKRTIAEQGLDAEGERDLGRVLRVLYLVFNEGYGGEVDLAAEAIRLARELVGQTDDPEATGLLALMLLHHARRASRFAADGSLVTLADQDRSRWDTALAAEAVDLLHAALAADRLGEFQAQAAIAALHADAPSAQETDWPQVVGWYDELLALTGSPVVALNRAVAVGEADGPQAGLRALEEVPEGIPRREAAHAFLLERSGETTQAAELYARAAARASSTAERDHLTRQAARFRSR
ncbi:putative RNA polymerase sigma factor [Serinicoccus hydrothermalis]|uniref:Putative RNA polymerase sigma factor n=1 Tax=Serinicoccus hydrothermalis TaxID=1758689 RepID=A0A1B1ND73_9MICO|nr:sigma-70 family RNA polymerase sigma factor [Serinicoccus hydrothermalis]ANS79389.1 putative RNA polymerase sigma factor [Serinicoccus hydrothermalis]